MSINNYILNLLNIKDENIYIVKEIKEEMIKNKKYKIIEGFLSYKPEYCPHCGVVNESSNDIIKWGYRKNCKIRIPKQNNCLTRLILYKQRFYCKHCNNTFIAETSLVNHNKNISIDRFHIVIQAYNALNITRVKLCYKSNPYYNKLKNYWKLILKNENDLSSEKKYSKYFRKEMSQQEIVQFLVNTNKTLKTTYQCYQGIINSIKENDFNKFKNIVLHKNKSISDKMKQALKLYNENINYIENSFKYDINNGIIEGTNNLIKCIKRIAFGYKRFDHFVTRIFLIKGTLKG